MHFINLFTLWQDTTNSVVVDLSVSNIYDFVNNIHFSLKLEFVRKTAIIVCQLELYLFMY
jgi:hypothetical protein